MQRINPLRALIAAFVIVVALLVTALNGSLPFIGAQEDDASSGQAMGATQRGPARVGQLAPDFVLLDLSGAQVSLSSFRGQTVLLNFWATWCVPCRKEMPDMESAYRDQKGGAFVILAVNQREARDQAASFAERYGVTFPVLLDTNGSVNKAYRTVGLPESWIVDAKGILRDHHIGAYTTASLAETLRTWLPDAKAISKYPIQGGPNEGR